jgi:protease I
MAEPTTDERTALDGLRVACLTANEGVEQIELVQPRDALQHADAIVTLVAPEAGEIQAFDHLDKGDTFTADRAVADVSVDDFDALLLPGGVANPDALRMDADAVAFVRAMVEAGKPVAAICHAPWVLVEADLVRARRLTSWPSLQTDVRNAGGQWVDEEVVVCTGGPNLLVTSRKPDDLPRFCEEMLSAFANPALAVS